VEELAGLLGGVLFVGSAVATLVAWRNPDSGYLAGLLRYYRRRFAWRKDPVRSCAAACWCFIGLGIMSPAAVIRALSEPPLPSGPAWNAFVVASLVPGLATFVVALWIRLFDAPQRLRPAAYRVQG
jgi:hypothetical protein